ncbi:hypothetical protein LAZ67_1000784 [Cordylochernes scorpioides]|uniref:Uncharacterized protein n=1 Tax=Cordylochernes scorpioides TaxID=51811 RepID=A0ABY6JV21_9ARAC|nr:hypothetical protein LAZ67_1000784 [Cordylochernes scorpioides]
MSGCAAPVSSGAFHGGLEEHRVTCSGTGTWKKVVSGPGDRPSGRRGHTAVVHNGAMHVYGGYQDLRGSSSELWSFDFGTNLVLV